MAYSFVDTPGDGATVSFAVPFPYLDQANVKTSVNGVDVPHTWSNSSLVSITPAPAAGATVRVYRTTERSERLVDFEDDSIFDEALLDQMNNQLFYIAQETLDIAERTSSETATQVGLIQEIVNAADAKADAATATAAGAVSTANTAKATADAAKVAADAATAASGAATVTANTAKATADTAKSTANTAKATADGVDAKATNALTTANGIDAKASTALSTANTAKATADASKATADGIDGKATTALATANAAKTAADSAKSTAEGINAKVVGAEYNAGAALYNANQAYDLAVSGKATAEGIDAKATTAQTNAATALSTANAAKTASDAAMQKGEYGVGAHRVASANMPTGAVLSGITGNGFFGAFDSKPSDFPANKGIYPVGWSVQRSSQVGAQLAISTLDANSPSTVQVRCMAGGAGSWGAWRQLVEAGMFGVGGQAKAISAETLDVPTLASGMYAVAASTTFRGLPVGYYSVDVSAFSLDGASVQVATELNSRRQYKRTYVTNAFIEVDNPDVIANLTSRLAFLEGASGFTAIYPNGGTAAAPANVTVNSRYVMANPFPLQQVFAVAEILIGDKWGETGWFYSSGGYGVKASQLDANTIVVQTGNARIGYNSNSSGDPFGQTNTGLTTAPCRVKVWKCRS